MNTHHVDNTLTPFQDPWLPHPGSSASYSLPPPPPPPLPIHDAVLDLDDLDIDHDSVPPAYVEGPALRAATVVQSQRYSKNSIISILHRVIAPGTFAYRDHPEERILPPEWLEFTHPEGKVYFYHPRLRIVTEAWIYNPIILQRIFHWANEFFTIIQQHQINLPQSSELCLELDPPDEDGEGGMGLEGCSYYLVDHKRRTEFWVDSVTTNGLELPAVTSITHLKLVLEQHYWTHVEYFPMHLQLPDEAENELQGVLLHACADAMTSDLSTSPLSPEKCRAYLELLRNTPTTPALSGYKNCIVARLWGEFARNRHINLHGEENARLCRDQLLNDDPETQFSYSLLVANYVLFNVPERHLRSLKNLFVDEIAYTEHWQKFMRLIIREWQESAFGSMILLITELILFMNLSRNETERVEMWASIQNASCLASILLAAGSVLVGVVLVRHHKQLAETHASEATDFLAEHQHPTLGLRPLASIYAIPFGALTWSILFFATSLILLSLHLKNRLTQILTWCFCFCLAVTAIFFFSLFGRYHFHLRWFRLSRSLFRSGLHGLLFGSGLRFRCRFWRSSSSTTASSFALLPTVFTNHRNDVSDNSTSTNNNNNNIHSRISIITHTCRFLNSSFSRLGCVFSRSHHSGSSSENLGLLNTTSRTSLPPPSSPPLPPPPISSVGQDAV